LPETGHLLVTPAAISIRRDRPRNSLQGKDLSAYLQLLVINVGPPSRLDFQRAEILERKHGKLTATKIPPNKRLDFDRSTHHEAGIVATRTRLTHAS
jgi:DNA-nicking Smr family endonuclease